MSNAALILGPSDTLTLSLQSAITTTNPTYVISYVDHATQTPGAAAGSFNGTGSVNALSGASAGYRLVTRIDVHNEDTVGARAIAKVSGRRVSTRYLQPGDDCEMLSPLPYTPNGDMTKAVYDPDNNGVIAVAGEVVGQGDAATMNVGLTPGTVAGGDALASEISRATNAEGLKANAADLGSAAAEDVEAFATAAQGALADSAVQPATLASHTGNTSNPHAVTKAQVGLGNCDNTSDAEKPVSTAQATINGLKADLVGGTVPEAQLPDSALLAIGELASTAYRGDRGKVAYDHSQDTTSNPHAVTKAQVGLGNCDNTADIDKPLSIAAQTALDLKADLVGGKIPSTQLPGFVDDVIEAADFSSLPAEGESGKIYVTLDTNLQYRWSGTVYVPISVSLALGETSGTAYRGDRGKTAYDHSQITTGNPHGTTVADLNAVPNSRMVNGHALTADVTVTKSDVGLGNVDNTSDANKPVSTAQAAAIALKQDASTALALGETSGTAYRGDRGKVAYDHSQDTTSNPHAVTKAQVGLGNADNTADLDKPLSTAAQTALAGKADVDDARIPAQSATDLLAQIRALNADGLLRLSKVMTYATGFSSPRGLAFDADGNLYVANYNANTVSKVTPAGVVTTFASGFSSPYGLAFDPDGNLYVGNYNTNTVSKVTPAGDVTTFASGFNGPRGLAFDADGNLYVANGGSGTVSKVTPAGVVTTFASGFSGPLGLAFDPDGNLYVGNSGTNTVSKVTPAGAVTTFASGFSGPRGLAFDPDGNLYVGNYNTGTVSKVTPAGVVTTFATGFSGPYGLAFDADGNLYVGDYNTNTVSKVTPLLTPSVDETAYYPKSGGALSGTTITGPSANTLYVGTSDVPCAGGYTQTTFIQTSMREAKTSIRDFSALELAVARAIVRTCPRIYQLVTSVAEKGLESARLHSGCIYEEVYQAFVNGGLDPERYSILCASPRPKKTTRTELREKETLVDGRWVVTTETVTVEEPVYEDLPMVDADGNALLDADGNPRMKLTPVFETDETGAVLMDKGLRYEELQIWIAAGLREMISNR